jgi:hypothetical protein
MMPSTSKKQHNFMAAVAHNPAFAKKAGVPQSVGKEFNKADKGKTFKQGGDMKKMNMGGYADGGMPMVMKDGKKVPTFAADGVGKMKHGGMAKSGMHKMPDGKMMKDSAMKNGGMAKADMKQDKGMMQKAVNKHEGRLHKGATMTKLASGGMAPSKMGAVKTSKTIDGIATKGKTKGTMIAMKRGGKC